MFFSTINVRMILTFYGVGDLKGAILRWTQNLQIL